MGSFGFLASLFAFAVLSVSNAAQADDKRVQGRILVSQLKPAATEFKNELTSKGIPDLGNYLRIGVDFTYPVFTYLDLGFRYENMTATGPGSYSSTGTPASKATMNSLQAIARIPIFKVSFFRFDVFGGYGMSASEVELITSTQSAKIAGGGGWHPEDAQSSSYGSSVGVGYKGYYFGVEAGRTMNVNQGLRRTGTLATTYGKFDLSADYIAFGFIYDGDIKVGGK